MRLTVAAITICACLTIDRAFAQDLAVVPQTEAIPKNNYKTWTLFLICNPKWLSPMEAGSSGTQKELYSLYDQFTSFGRTIGTDNLAVWFWKKTSAKLSNSALVSNVDVERSVRFCKAWSLTPSAGPHVVVTPTYPDESALSKGLPANTAVFELGNMKTVQISDLLAKLVDELLQNKRVEAPAAAAAPTSGMISLLQAVQRIINNVGCAWTFKISAGPLATEVHSCQQK
jgi:hypothetical protein